MAECTTKELVEQLQKAGLKIAVKHNGNLVLTPSERLNDDLRGLIRANKAALVDWLTAENDKPMTPEAQVVEYRLYSKLQPPPEIRPPTAATDAATDWRELAVAYHAHHFNCRQCIAAGRGSRYGLRCGVGAALWRDYSDPRATV